MQKIRKHWQIAALALGALVLAGFFWWRGAEARSPAFFAMVQSQVSTTYEPISELRRSAVLGILADISLDRDALTALNLTSQQAESVLSTVRNWQATNEATLASLNNTIHQKVAAVYALEKAIAMGPADPAHEPNLALARQDLQTSRAGYRTALASLELSVNTLLSASQRDTWTAIKTGHGQHMPIRMLALSDAQRLALSDARQRYDRQHAAAANADERSAAVSTWQNVLDQILTTQQKSIVASYQNSLASSSAAVNEAFETVLATSAG